MFTKNKTAILVIRCIHIGSQKFVMERC